MFPETILTIPLIFKNLVFKKKRTSNFSPKTAAQHQTVEQPETSSMSRFAQFAGEIQQEEGTRNITTGESVERKLTANISGSKHDPIGPLKFWPLSCTHERLTSKANTQWQRAYGSKGP